MSRLSIAVAVGCVVTLGTAIAHAAANAEQKCQAARAKAAGAYALCQQRTQARVQTSGVVPPLYPGPPFQRRALKCRAKYRGTWAKLQTKATLAGSSCIGARFNDKGTTVTDNLTGLQWEEKTSLDGTTNLADRQDADNSYTWCSDVNSDFSCDNVAAADGTLFADGTVFTDFLRSLNSGGCFAGQCDWRLPTRDELQTILSPDAVSGGVCTTPSCVDAIFGPTHAGIHWSATSSAGTEDLVWYIDFSNGGVSPWYKPSVFSVRAVRGGL